MSCVMSMPPRSATLRPDLVEAALDLRQVSEDQIELRRMRAGRRVMTMRAYSGLTVRLLGVCATLAMLAGCGGSQTSSVVPNSAAQRLGSDLSQNAVARTQDLLYVSHHDDGSVDIYSYPEGKYWGQLKDVRASGLCSDSNGDVFIPTGNSVREYAHGETRPIAVLHGSLGGIVQACAVDGTTGDLAVA